jgi:hypothetical protein
MRRLPPKLWSRPRRFQMRRLASRPWLLRIPNRQSHPGPLQKPRTRRRQISRHIPRRRRFPLSFRRQSKPITSEKQKKTWQWRSRIFSRPAARHTVLRKTTSRKKSAASLTSRAKPARPAISLVHRTSRKKRASSPSNWLTLSKSYRVDRTAIQLRPCQTEFAHSTLAACELFALLILWTRELI